MNAVDLIRVQAQTLYTMDGAEQLYLSADRTVPPHDWEPAPRFFMGRTAQGNVWYFRHDLTPRLVAELNTLCQTEPPLQPGQEASIAPAIRALLGGGEEWRGPAYLVPTQQNPAKKMTGPAIEVTAKNADLLDAEFPNTARRIRAGHAGPMTAVLEDGQAVAVCSCVRLGRRAAEAGVYTLETSRGKGYAAAVTALWAQLVREQGLLPLYSTESENTASQAVAQKLGAKLFGEDWSIS